jgi:HPt (histidine-containing phosphotransfer) domain-containing protein
MVATLDRAPLRALRALEEDGAGGLVARAIDNFIRRGGELLHQMAATIERNDVAELGRLARSFEFSSTSLGAGALARQCQELEILVREGAMPDDIMQHLGLLRETFAGARRALDRELAHQD